MKLHKLFTLAVFLLVPACASTPHENMNVKTPTSAPSTILAYNYQCESGHTVTTNYQTTDSATLQYRGRTYNLKIAVSGSGSRYVGGELEWWTKGSNGTIFRHNNDGTSGNIIELCTET